MSSEASGDYSSVSGGGAGNTGYTLLMPILAEEGIDCFPVPLDESFLR